MAEDNLFMQMCGARINALEKKLDEMLHHCIEHRDGHEKSASELTDKIIREIRSLRELLVKHDASTSNYWRNVEMATNRQVAAAERMVRGVDKLVDAQEKSEKNGRNGKAQDMATLVRWLVIAVILAAFGSKGLELLVLYMTKGGG